MIWASVLSAASAFLINLILIPVTLRLAHRFKWYDLPDKRKIHTGLIPRLGGPGLFLSFTAASLLTPAVISALTRGRIAAALQPRFAALFTGVFLIHAVGLYDDFKNLKALPKFILQLLAAAIVASGGFLISSFTLPYLGTVSLGLAGYPVTVIWLVGIANSINLIDGMDGLAGGISAFGALSMGVIALIQGAPQTAILTLALFGALLAFLIFNFPPAKIFMGDSGSLFLGLCLAALPLAGGISKASAFGSLIVPITVLTVPILDTATAILRRIRKRRPIISPDKEHVHHKLLALGLTERQILAVIYSLCAYLGLISVTSVILPKEINVYLIIVVWVGSLLGYWLLNYLELKNRKSGEQSAAKGSSRDAFRSG